MENEIIVNWVTYVKKEDNQKKQSKRGDKYWFINTIWEVCDGNNKVEEEKKPFVFPTEADVIKARDKQLALYRISSYAEDKRGKFVLDWNNEKQDKRYITYCIVDSKYVLSCDRAYIATNIMYLADKKHCEEIIEKFKDDLDILFDIKWWQNKY